MANFQFQKQDLQDPHNLAKSFNAHTINRSPDGGAPKPLRTTRSVDPDPQKGMTTYNISEIMQGSATAKSPTASYDVFNQITSNSLSSMLADPQSKADKTLGNQAQVVPEDIIARAGALGATTLDAAAGTGTAGAPATGAGAPVAGAAGVAIETGRQQVGKPYEWGATGPNSFDCSGFTSFCWRAAGVEIGRDTHAQARQNTAIDMSQIQPGDLILMHGDSHVVLYIGNNQLLNAPGRGKFVRYDDINYWNTDKHAVRPNT